MPIYCTSSCWTSSILISSNSKAPLLEPLQQCFEKLTCSGAGRTLSRLLQPTNRTRCCRDDETSTGGNSDRRYPVSARSRRAVVRLGFPVRRAVSPDRPAKYDRAAASLRPFRCRGCSSLSGCDARDLCLHRPHGDRAALSRLPLLIGERVSPAAGGRSLPTRRYDHGSASFRVLASRSCSGLDPGAGLRAWTDLCQQRPDPAVAQYVVYATRRHNGLADMARGIVNPALTEARMSIQRNFHALDASPIDRHTALGSCASGCRSCAMQHRDVVCPDGFAATNSAFQPILRIGHAIAWQKPRPARDRDCMPD